MTNIARRLRMPLLCGLTILVTSRPALTQSDSASAHAAGERAGDGQHAFDFEIGAWKAHISRLVRPLSGSSEWVEYEGTSVVRKIWDGKGNLGELDVRGPAGRITGLSLRLYNPQTRQWNISWANARDGALGPAMYGGFESGRGEFYNQELLDGRAILVRFIFSEISPTSFRLEQAFSDDGGKSWEANWRARFTR